MTAYRPSRAHVIQRTAPDGADMYHMSIALSVPTDVPAVVAFGGELTNSDSHANSYGKMLYRALAEENVSGVMFIRWYMILHRAVQHWNVPICFIVQDAN